jgi:Mg-chelatase subunit ChlI
VLAIAGVSILAVSGVFGGNDPQDPVDTGVAPRASQVEVPEGEAAAVIDDLRRAAAEARRKRLADKRGAKSPPDPDPIPETPAPPAAEDQGSTPQNDTPSEPQDQGNAEPAPQDDTPADEPAANGGENAAGEQAQVQSESQTQTIPTP